MKKIILLALIVMVTFAHGQDASFQHEIILADGSFTSIQKQAKLKKQVDPSVEQEFCEAASRFAKSTFNARQRGASAAQMYKTIDAKDENVRKAMQHIINDAFQYPMGLNGKDLDKASVEYANKYFLACMAS